MNITSHGFVNPPNYIVQCVTRSDTGPIAEQLGGPREIALADLLDELAPQAPTLGHLNIRNAYGELVAVIWQDGGIERIG